MRFLTEKIGKLNIGWNERALGEADFYKVCRRFKVKVTEMPLSVGGVYYRVAGRDFIAVNSRIAGTEKLAVLFHELGHFLFHAPDSGATANFHRVGRRTRKEREADVFALCALIPRSDIETRATEDLIDDGFSRETIAVRRAVHERHGL